MEKLEWWGYRQWENFEDMFNRLHTIPACDGRTDRRTAEILARHSPRYTYAYVTRMQKWKSCIGQTPSSTKRISCWKMQFLIKNFQRYAYMSEFPDMGWKLNWKHWQSAEENPQDGYSYCPATRHRQSAFSEQRQDWEDEQLLFSWQAKNAPINSWAFAWNWRSAFIIRGAFKKFCNLAW